MQLKVNINDVDLENIHIAVGVGIIFGLGMVSAVILKVWGVLVF